MERLLEALAARHAKALGVSGSREFLVTLGEIHNKDQAEERLTDAERSALEDAFKSKVSEASTAGTILAYADRAYGQWLEQQVREHGGMIFRQTTSYKAGRDRPIRECHVERFRGQSASTPIRRGHVGDQRRPAAKRTTSRSTSHGDPDLAGDEPPPHPEVKRAPRERGPSCCSNDRAVGAARERTDS